MTVSGTSRLCSQTWDIAIIGGGFAGAATAYALGRAGIGNVAVLERESACGYHASGRNAALCRQLVEDEYMPYVVDGARFLRDPPAGFTAHRLLDETGSILVVDTAAQHKALLDQAAQWRLPCEELTMAEVRARDPQLRRTNGHGGVYVRSDGVIDVHELLQAYLRAARASGHIVVTRCNVRNISTGGNYLRLDTSQGSVAARFVVNAAGAWAGPVGVIAGGAPRRLLPIKRHLFITEPTEAAVRGPFVWHIGATEFYARKEGSGFLLSGCDATPSDPRDAVPDNDAIPQLAQRLAQCAPAYCDLGIARSWACLRTFADHPGPIISQDTVQPRLFWVAGLGGHGATASAAIGQAAAKHLVSIL